MTDLAGRHPEKLRELVDLWWFEAGNTARWPMIESLMKKREGLHFKRLHEAQSPGPEPAYALLPGI
jgi:hypothetical protein